MTQCARANGLEVTLATYGLLNDLLARSRGVGAVSPRGVPGRSLFPGFVGPTKFQKTALLLNRIILLQLLLI